MWLTLLPVILQYGLPFAESLFQKISSGAAPTAQDFADLRVLAQANAVKVMTERLVAQGVDPTSPKGIALLALVLPPTATATFVSPPPIAPTGVGAS